MPITSVREIKLHFFIICLLNTLPKACLQHDFMIIYYIDIFWFHIRNIYCYLVRNFLIEGIGSVLLNIRYTMNFV